MARPSKCRCICSVPKYRAFSPTEDVAAGQIVLGYDEYETLRLIDYEHFSQAQCAGRMRVSRPTVARMYETARAKLADFLVNGKALVIEGGDVTICTKPRPECYGAEHCCTWQQCSAP